MLTTASTRPCLRPLRANGYYKNDYGRFIFFDPDCDGTGSINFPNLWILTVAYAVPSTTAVNDLDGELRINAALLYLY